MLMPSRKITEVKQGLVNVEKGQGLTTSTQRSGVLSSHVSVEACLSREGPTWTTWISGSFLNDIKSKGDSTELMETKGRASTYRMMTPRIFQ